jgi:phospholipid/cholesterol/gamma-HCH transport system substrate-binding protein
MSIKNFRERSPLLIGIISIIALVAGTTFSFYIDKLPFIKQAYDVKAEFADAAGLNPENQVRVAGIKVGTVTGVAIDGDRVLVTMEIENSTDVPKDAFAEIKLATLLGTKFVALQGSGGAPFLEEGDTIPLENTAVPYEIYQASNEGTAVLEDLDGDALNDMLVELTKLTRIAKDDVGTALEGLNDLGAGLSGREDELRKLLAGSNDLTDLLADESDEIVRLIDASNDVLASLSSQREEVQSLLEATKLMASEVTRLVRANRSNLDSILADLHDALVVLERNVEHLDMAFEYAGPSSRYFGSIWTQGRWGDIFGCAIVVASTCESDE